MTRHEGSCHCGAVRFAIDVDVDRLIDCNCSVCTKKGILHIPVAEEQFSLLSGEASLTLYRFGSAEASHWFCKHCGIHPFGRPRSDPGRYTVNARCLDDYEALAARVPTNAFDGQDHPKDRA